MKTIAASILPAKCRAMRWSTIIWLFKMFAPIVVLCQFDIAYADDIGIPRTALVIGNAKYSDTQWWSELQNPQNDAFAIGSRLKELHFELSGGKIYLNINRADFDDALEQFFAKITAQKGVALLFYSGHGVEISGANYLVPTDLKAQSQRRVERDGISLSYILSRMKESGVTAGIVFIDACRQNRLPVDDGTKGTEISTGLGNSYPPKGLFVVYSAGVNSPAYDRLSADDKDPNGVFTRVLLKHMRDEPQDDIRMLVQKVREDVEVLAKSTATGQFPAYYDQLVGSFSFAEKEFQMPADRSKAPLTRGAVEKGAKISALQPKSKSTPPPRNSVGTKYLKWLDSGWAEVAYGKTEEGQFNKDRQLQFLFAKKYVAFHTRRVLKILSSDGKPWGNEFHSADDTDIQAIASDPLGEFLAIGQGYSGKARSFFGSPDALLWNPRSNSTETLHFPASRSGGVMSAAFSPSGHLVSLGGFGIRVFSREGKILADYGTGIFSIESGFIQQSWISEQTLVAAKPNSIVLFKFDENSSSLRKMQEIDLDGAIFALRSSQDKGKLIVLTKYDASSPLGSNSVAAFQFDSRNETLRSIFNIKLDSLLEKQSTLIIEGEPKALAGFDGRHLESADGFWDDGSDSAIWFANICDYLKCYGATIWGSISFSGESSVPRHISEGSDLVNGVLRSEDGTAYGLWYGRERIAIGPPFRISVAE